MSQGRKVRSQLDRFQQQAQVGTHTHTPNENAGPGLMPVGDLPRKYRLKDQEWASHNAMKQALMREAGDPRNPAMTRFGQVQLTDRDLRALEERKKIDVARAFDGWFGQNFNTNDLPTRLLGEQLNPEYYKEREEAMVERAQMALRLELMKLYGPRSEEDLILIYGLQNKLIQLDEDSLSIAGGEYSDANEISRKYTFNNAVSRFLISDADNTDPYASDAERQPFSNDPNAAPPSGRQFGTFAQLLDILN